MQVNQPKNFFVNVREIHPGQHRYSQQNVDEKIQNFVKSGRIIKSGSKFTLGTNKNGEKFKAVLNKDRDAVPVIKSPLGYLLIDGHHHVKASLQVGCKKIPIKVIADHSYMSEEEFACLAAKNGWIHFKQLNGENEFPPKSFNQLVNDPNRYYARTIRKDKEDPLWIKDKKTPPFAEFKIADIMYEYDLIYRKDMSKEEMSIFNRIVKDILYANKERLQGLELAPLRPLTQDIINQEPEKNFRDKSLFRACRHANRGKVAIPLFKDAIKQQPEKLELAPLRPLNQEVINQEPKKNFRTQSPPHVCANANRGEAAIPLFKDTVKQEPEKFDRKFPPFGINDTIGKNRNYKLCSFEDKNILEIHNFVATKKLNHKIFAYLSEYGKWVVLQQAKRSCTAGTSAMLILDHDKTFDLNPLKSRNLGKTEDIVRDITKAELKPLVSELKNDSEAISNLQKLIQLNGSAIVSVNTVGAHSIIVDSITNGGVRIRDPNHGWEVTVSMSAFKSAFSGGDIIQISKN